MSDLVTVHKNGFITTSQLKSSIGFIIIIKVFHFRTLQHATIHIDPANKDNIESNHPNISGSLEGNRIQLVSYSTYKSCLHYIIHRMVSVITALVK